MDGFVYVEDGATLNIPAGTVIKGKQSPTNGSDIASALIISRGAKIYALGSVTEPIIFTTEYDSVALIDDGVADILDFRDASDRGFGVVWLFWGKRV